MIRFSILKYFQLFYFNSKITMENDFSIQSSSSLLDEFTKLRTLRTANGPSEKWLFDLVIY